MVSAISPNINYQTSAGITSNAEPTVWNQELYMDRMQETPFEYLKQFTNAIFRNDVPAGDGIVDKMKGVNIRFNLSRELLGAGRTGNTQLVGYEESIVGNTFDYQAQLVRHALGSNDVVLNTNMIDSLYHKDQDAKLNRWAAVRKEKNDIARIIAGAAGYNVTYGNGLLGTAASISSANTMNPRSFQATREILVGNNAPQVGWINESEAYNVPQKFFIQLADSLMLDRMSIDPTWQNLMSQANQNKGWSHPLLKKAYGIVDNMIIIPVEGLRGFGSPLRPEAMVGTTGVSLANGATVAVKCGLPKMASATTYTSYDPSTEGIDYVEYFNAFITASGITNLPITIKRIGATDLTGFTVTYTNGYTLTLTNGSGAAYTPTAGDKFISNIGCNIGLGASAMVSSYASDVYFTDDDRDYKLNRGRAVSFWEGGSVFKDSTGAVPSIALNFVYSSALTQS